MLETRVQPYVLAVRSNHCLRFWTEEGLEETNPAAMADALARDAWATHAAGEGAKGLRLYGGRGSRCLRPLPRASSTGF